MIKKNNLNENLIFINAPIDKSKKRFSVDVFGNSLINKKKLND